MRTSKLTSEQMVHILRQGDGGVPVVEPRGRGPQARRFFIPPAARWTWRDEDSLTPRTTSPTGTHGRGEECHSDA
jgi:hypothetical protein